MGGSSKGYSSKDAARDREAARAESEAQRIAAENEAQLKANSEMAATRSRYRRNRLISGSGSTSALGTAAPAPTSALAAAQPAVSPFAATRDLLRNIKKQRTV